MGRVRVILWGGGEKIFCCRNTNKTNVGFYLVLGIISKELQGVVWVIGNDLIVLNIVVKRLHFVYIYDFYFM